MCPSTARRPGGARLLCFRHGAAASCAEGSKIESPRAGATASTGIRSEYVRVRALVQRVSGAAVSVDGEEIARIGRGLVVLLGVRDGDGPEQADRLAGKLERLRIFEDDEGRMNLSVRDVDGELLVVSQFTLYGDARKGNRPSFVDAAPPEMAEPLYERVREALGAKGGKFGARMEVALVNEGPVTLLLEVG
jgi:D-aminoacyl-tRNA deacylase